ncbi:type IV pilin-like G/H family protein [Pannus brasiliensis CCIBt3594]|uniref:Type IV pilin-like G/H family protein n=1 Tax=Pannus brasiliensis CCIBt3594 TaxID=1427578 RepID=A0AAW9QVD1_9CHRO
MKRYDRTFNRIRRRKFEGFTLIELLVVIIILGILAAIALPQLLGQVAKGRQAEARNTLGAINRAQQAYRYENGVFATLSDLPTKIPTKFYRLNQVGAADAIGSAYTATAEAEFNNDIKNYAGAAGQTPLGTYTGIVCEDENPLDDNVATSNTVGVLACVNGVQVK